MFVRHKHAHMTLIRNLNHAIMQNADWTFVKQTELMTRTGYSRNLFKSFWKHCSFHISYVLGNFLVHFHLLHTSCTLYAVFVLYISSCRKQKCAWDIALLLNWLRVDFPSQPTPVVLQDGTEFSGCGWLLLVYWKKTPLILMLLLVCNT